MEILIQNLTKKYSNKLALSGVNLSIQSGGVFGLIGPNGAGKSTLMNAIATLTKPTSGQILLNNSDIQKHPNDIRRILGYLPQDVAVYPNLSAEEFLSYMAALKSLSAIDAKKQIDDLLEIFHLSEHKKKQLHTYSGGMRQRVGLASALLGNPQVIILDEPSVGLDPEERITLRNLLCELAKTRIVLLSTHIISDIEQTASNIAVIKDGTVLFCGYADTFTSETDGNMENAYLCFIKRGDCNA